MAKVDTTPPHKLAATYDESPKDRTADISSDSIIGSKVLKALASKYNKAQ